MSDGKLLNSDTYEKSWQAVDRITNSLFTDIMQTLLQSRPELKTLAIHAATTPGDGTRLATLLYEESNEDRNT